MFGTALIKYIIFILVLLVICFTYGVLDSFVFHPVASVFVYHFVLLPICNNNNN